MWLLRREQTRDCGQEAVRQECNSRITSRCMMRLCQDAGGRTSALRLCQEAADRGSPMSRQLSRGHVLRSLLKLELLSVHKLGQVGDHREWVEGARAVAVLAVAGDVGTA